MWLCIAMQTTNATTMPKARQDIIATAIKWRTLFAADQVTDADRASFALWLAADPRHQAAYTQADQFWTNLGDLKTDDLDPEFFLPSWREQTASAVRRITRNATAWISSPLARPAFLAGMLCLGLALTLAVISGQRAHNAAQTHVYSAPIGQIRTVEMDDASHITLGADTTVTVIFTPEERHVRMDAGEAFFQVSPDRNRPFVVRSQDVRITVHGTAFDLRATAQGASVTVSEGVVSVTRILEQTETPTAGTPLPPSTHPQSTILGAGDRIAINTKSDVDMITKVRPENIASWRNNFLVYVDAPLAELVSDINRYRTQKVRIADTDIATMTVTATFDSRDTTTMLHSLEEALPLRLENTPHEIVLRRIR